MNIQTNELKEFINRSIVFTRGLGSDNKPSMRDLLLTTSGNTLRVESTDIGDNIQIDFNTLLETSGEEEVFPIVDSVQFLKILKNEVSGELDISTEGEYIIIRGEHVEVKYPLCPPENITTMTRYPSNRDKLIKEGEGRGYGKAGILPTRVTTTASAMTEAVGRSGDTYSKYEYLFEVKDGQFSISISTLDRGGVKKTPTAIITGGDAVATYATGVDSIFKGMHGTVILHFGNGMPMVVNDELDNIAVFFPVADKE